ncbi:MAG: hypothetical protein ACO1Q7_00090 [Gemmatimonas sp.]
MHITSSSGISRRSRSQEFARCGVALALVVSMSGCDRFKERILGIKSTPDVAGPTTIRFDPGNAQRDSIARKNAASADSLAAMTAARLAADTVTGAVLSKTAPPSGQAPIEMPQQLQTRAQMLGDSIANARVQQIVGQNLKSNSPDSARGVIRMDGTGAGSRPILVANNGKTTITLTGMGTEGLSQVLGSDVVVRGMRVSPRDLVVSGYSVRSVDGIKVVDGRLTKAPGGGWLLELSDKSGLRKYPAISPALQAFEGSRVWVADEGTDGIPQLYGVIEKR